MLKQYEIWTTFLLVNQAFCLHKDSKVTQWLAANAEHQQLWNRPTINYKTLSGPETHPMPVLKSALHVEPESQPESPGVDPVPEYNFFNSLKDDYIKPIGDLLSQTVSADWMSQDFGGLGAAFGSVPEPTINDDFVIGDTYGVYAAAPVLDQNPSNQLQDQYAPMYNVLYMDAKSQVSPYADTDTGIKGLKIVAGPNILTNMEYVVDGNYKLMIDLSSDIDFDLMEITAERCQEGNSGISFINKNGGRHTIVMIDMSICKFDHGDQTKTENRIYKSPRGKPVSRSVASVVELNTPIGVSFSVLPSDRNGVDESLLIHSNYIMEASSNFHEDYILEFDSHANHLSQIHIDENGDLAVDKNNLQFGFTSSSESLTDDDDPNKISLQPTNGFRTDTFIYIPEMCFLKDKYSGDEVQLWEMTTEKNGCQNRNDDRNSYKMSYNDQTQVWNFSIDFYKALDQDQNLDQSMSQKNLISDYVITCSVRVCGNESGNICSEKIKVCDYIE